MYLCNFVIISQCKKVWPFNLNKLKVSSNPKKLRYKQMEIFHQCSHSSPQPLGQFQPNLVQSIPGGWEFKFVQVFEFDETLNPFYPGMLFAKFCRNWPSSSIEGPPFYG